MSKVSKVYEEIFRPKSMEMLIATDRIKSQLQRGLVQNILLEGPAGTGKSSTAFILAGGKDNPNCKYVNASKDGRQEIIEELAGFCRTAGLFTTDSNQHKVIIFDEVDGASTAFFNSIRAFIEEFESTTRFIMTCNLVAKVPAPIISRMNVISFRPTSSEEENYLMNEYKTRIGAILSHIKVGYTDETLTKFVKAEFPDMRKLMNKLQRLEIMGCTELDDSSMASTFDYEDLFKLCLNAPDAVSTYKLVQSNYSTSVPECMVSLGDDFIQYIQEFHPEKNSKIPNIIVNVADYQHKLATVIDGTIALQALIFTIQNILK